MKFGRSLPRFRPDHPTWGCVSRCHGTGRTVPALVMPRVTKPADTSRGETPASLGLAILEDPGGRRRRIVAVVGKAATVLFLLWLAAITIGGLGLSPLPTLPIPGLSSSDGGPVPLTDEQADLNDARPAPPARAVAVVGTQASGGGGVPGLARGPRSQAGGRERARVPSRGAPGRTPGSGSQPGDRKRPRVPGDGATGRTPGSGSQPASTGSTTTGGTGSTSNGSAGSTATGSTGQGTSTPPGQSKSPPGAPTPPSAPSPPGRTDSPPPGQGAAPPGRSDAPPGRGKGRSSGAGTGRGLDARR